MPLSNHLLEVSRSYIPDLSCRDLPIIHTRMNSNQENCKNLASVTWENSVSIVREHSVPEGENQLIQGQTQAST